MAINFQTNFNAGDSISMFVASNLDEPEVEIWILSCLGGGSHCQNGMTWAMVDVRNEHIDLLKPTTFTITTTA